MPVEDLRQQLELRLRGELLRDWCRQLAAEDESVEFDDGWCSGQRVIRFCTRVADALVDGWRGTGDAWGLGRLVFYEIENDTASLRMSLSVSTKGLTADLRTRVSRALEELQIVLEQRSDGIIGVREWFLGDASCSANDAVAATETTWQEQVLPFERLLSAKLLGEDGSSQKKPVDEHERKPEKEGVDSSVEQPLVEGAELAVVSDRFERNKKARALCIAARGAVCAVCGFDFGKVYGPQFAGTIDVHHRTPLNEIRRDYVVDPVRDLVPVCPNCHRVLHSKPGGGAYTVDEVRAMLGRG
ncbi:MAG: HNH endonuclease [Atopobiaceae bacterium]|nr:HNH endonuclease [Atopobiaceae bacterium]